MFCGRQTEWYKFNTYCGFEDLKLLYSNFWRQYATLTDAHFSILPTLFSGLLPQAAYSYCKYTSSHVVVCRGTNKNCFQIKCIWIADYFLIICTIIIASSSIFCYITFVNHLVYNGNNFGVRDLPTYSIKFFALHVTNCTL